LVLIGDVDDGNDETSSINVFLYRLLLSQSLVCSSFLLLLISEIRKLCVLWPFTFTP